MPYPGRGMTSDCLPLDPGRLSDGALQLVLVARRNGDPAKGWVPGYAFEMRVAGQPGSVGHLNLRIGHTHHVTHYAGHIGYGVDAAWRGRRFAARAVALVLPFAKRCGIDPVWITCTPGNRPSLRTLEILGAERIGEVDAPPDTDMYERGETRKVRFRLAGGPDAETPRDRPDPHTQPSG